MSRQYLIPGSPFGGYINETTARQYIVPNVVYLNDTSAGVAAALAGTATSVSTASGTLTAGINLAASISGSSTASGSLSTAIQLAGSVICVCTAGSGVGGGTAGGTLTVGSTGNTDIPTKFPPPPPITHLGMNDPSWRDWFYKINHKVQKAGQIVWTQLSFSGSNLTDISTRNHNDLQNIQGGAAGDEYHLTLEQHDKVDMDEILLWLSF